MIFTNKCRVNAGPTMEQTAPTATDTTPAYDSYTPAQSASQGFPWWVLILVVIFLAAKW